MRENRYETLLLVLAFLIGFASLIWKGVKEVKETVSEWIPPETELVVKHQKYTRKGPFRKLSISNSFGSIEVVGEERDDVEINAVFKLREDTSPRLNIFEEGKELVVEPPAGSRRIKVSSIKVKIPAGMEVEARNKYGDIYIKSTAAPVKAENKYSDIVITGATDVRAENRYGSIEIKDAGDVIARNKYRDVILTNVAHFDVSSPYGRVKIEGAKGGSIRGKYSEIILKNISGDVKVEAGYRGLRFENVGKVKVIAKYSEITVRRALGADIEDDYGKIRLSQIAGDIRLRGSYNNIEGRHLSGGVIEMELHHPKIEIEEFSSDIKGRVSRATVVLSGKSCGDVDLRLENSRLRLILPIRLLSFDIEVDRGIKLLTDKISSELVREGRLVFGKGKCRIKILGRKSSVEVLEAED